MNLKALASVYTSILILCACGGGSSGNSGDPIADRQFDGTVSSVETIYTPEQLDAIQQLGLTLNLGDSPPNIEGNYFFSPVILQASSVPNEPTDIGSEINDASFSVTNQNTTTLTADLFLQELLGPDQGDTRGTGSFISGSGSLFTIYFVTETDYGDGALADTSVTISGAISELGIENIQLAAFVLDDRGDDTFFPSNTGRLLIDGDGLAVRQSVSSSDLTADSHAISYSGLFSRSE